MASRVVAGTLGAMKRIGLLAGLLVVMLGTAAMAQSPSPDTTTPYVPGDVTSLLPKRIGDADIDVVWHGSGLSSADSRDVAFWQAFLAGYGKEADDLQSATAVAVPPGGLGPDDLPLVIWALRIDGLPARTWAESYWSAIWETLRAGGSAGAYTSEWRDIDGRDVYATVWTPAELAEWRAVAPSMQLSDDTGYWLYPVGEVVFLVSIPFDWPVPPPTIVDVLAELP